jgi:hypothetical protein
VLVHTSSLPTGRLRTLVQPVPGSGSVAVATLEA